MEIKTRNVVGFEDALHAMRNPMNSWDKNDTTGIFIGPNDMELSKKLQKAGPEHCKHLRMIMVWADITAARYWWQEADTYRNGVEKISTSTMHKLTSRPLLFDDFEYEPGAEMAIGSVIRSLNAKMKDYQNLKQTGFADEAKDAWREIIQLLPQSYLQKRTVMFSYAALRNIIKQRTGHKLKEWKQFIDWCKTLPNSWMLFDEGDET